MAAVTAKSTICLCMIVKNEAHVIEQTLENMLPHIDTWCVCDTGSTDGTQDLVRRFFARHEMKGRLVEHEWRDFGHNRSLALAACEGMADYAWMMDADDLLVGNFQRPASLTAHGYSLRCGKEFTYQRTMIFRNGCGWHYVGVLHEYADCTVKNHVIYALQGDYYVDSRRLGARNLDPEKYKKDALILEAALLDEPENARYVFYLGQSWFDYRDYERSKAAYERRAAMGGYQEEVYYSLFRVALCMQSLGAAQGDIVAAFKRAHSALPSRAEPLYHIGLLYYDKEPEKAYGYYRRAHKLPFPVNQQLFIFKVYYDYEIELSLAKCAYRLEDYSEAYDHTCALLNNPALDNSVRRTVEAIRLRSAEHLNRDYYDKRCVNQLSKQRAKTRICVGIQAENYGHFASALNSFLNCCEDLAMAGEFLLVATGFQEEEKKRVKKRYPFVRPVWLPPSKVAEQQQLETFLTVCSEASSTDNTYLFYFDDKWRFFERRAYLMPLVQVLKSRKDMWQVLVNRHHLEVAEDSEALHERGYAYTINGTRVLDHFCNPYALVEKKNWKGLAPHPSLLALSHLSDLTLYNDDTLESFAERSANDCCVCYLDSTSALRLEALLPTASAVLVRHGANCVEAGDFYVYENQDCIGNDMGCLSKESAEERRKHCLLADECVAYNSYGWLKHSLSDIVPMRGVDLYVKRSYKPNAEHVSGPFIAILGYVDQGVDPWHPQSVEGGIMGAEEAVIYLGQVLVEKFGCTVDVFANPPDWSPSRLPGANPRYFRLDNESVLLDRLHEVDRDRYDLIVSWRWPRNFLRLTTYGKRTALWSHNMCVGPFCPDGLDVLFSLSTAHEQSFHSYVPLLQKSSCEIVRCGNGIILPPPADESKREPLRCIYASSYCRGLHDILLCWPKIHAAHPEASLHLFHGFTTWDQWKSGERQTVETLIRTLPGVHEYGKVGHVRLYEEFQKSSLWLYPCRMPETFCITAIKAQACGCIPVVSRLAALQETVEPSAPSVQPQQPLVDYETLVKETMNRVVNDSEWTESMRERCRSFGGRFTWEAVAERWVAQINS